MVISIRVPESVVCVHIYDGTECEMFVMYCMHCCMPVSAVLQCVDVCNCDMLGVVNVYLNHLKLCVVCIDG